MLLRFLPDGWLEFLLRPFILMDPSAGIYFEEAAPDLRFAAFVIFLILVPLWRRSPRRFGSAQWQGILAVALMFFVWTAVIGNGRYFVAGLLLIGPLVVMTARALPGTPAFRSFALLMVMGVQLWVVQQNYFPNRWGLVHWVRGRGLPIEESPLRHRPAVFLTLSGISYSILVPRFDPASRWANIAGQHDILPGTPEYPRLQALFASPLSKYLVAPLNPEYMSAAQQPVGKMRELFDRTLTVHSLSLGREPCVVLRSNLSFGTPDNVDGFPPTRGFWICPVIHDPGAIATQRAADAAADQLADVFARVEQRCPRFFPPGNGIEKQFDGITMRHYPQSDVRLYIDVNGAVSYKYFRALNLTHLGTVAQVRAGNFQIACNKLPGRYHFPWEAQ